MTPTEKHMQEHLDWVRDCETPDTWEQIAYWGTVGVAAVSTLVLVFGCIGYFAGAYIF